MTVVNPGDQALTAVEVIDVVPAHVTVTDSAGAGVSGDRLSWLVDLPADSRAVLRYSGTVTGSAPAGAVLANTAPAPLSGSDTTSHPAAAAAAAPVAGPVVQPPAAPRPTGPLPLTGADFLAAVVVAAGGLAGGSALVLVARRRRVPSAGDPQAA